MSSIERSLQNEYVLEHIFGFLNLNDVKNCRLVNQNWKNVGSRILRRKTRVRFRFRFNLPKDGQEKLKEVIKVNESYFSGEDLTNNSPFDSFSFLGTFDLEMLEILKMGRYVKELDMNVCASKQLNGERFNVNVFLGVHLKRFHFDGSDLSGETKFHVSMNAIPFVQCLKLNGVEVDISKEVRRLCPKRINLGGSIKFSKNGVILSQFVINELFDLRETEFIKIFGDNMTLDLSQCANSKTKKDKVSLTYTNVVNWKMCDWKVGQLNLVGVPFEERNLMEIDSFTSDDGVVDFSAIHEPSKLIKVKCDVETNIVGPNCFFPNATCVNLKDESISAVRNFSLSENLIKVKLSCVTRGMFDFPRSMTIKIEDFPTHVKHLILENIRVEGRGACQTEFLHLKDRHENFEESGQYLKYFQGEYLCVSNEYLSQDYDPLSFILSQKRFKYFSIAGLKWSTDDDFRKTKFSELVDKMSDAYMFKGKKGLAVDSVELLNKSFYTSKLYYDLISKLENKRKYKPGRTGLARTRQK